MIDLSKILLQYYVNYLINISVEKIVTRKFKIELKYCKRCNFILYHRNSYHN